MSNLKYLILVVFIVCLSAQDKNKIKPFLNIFKPSSSTNTPVHAFSDLQDKIKECYKKGGIPKVKNSTSGVRIICKLKPLEPYFPF